MKLISWNVQWCLGLDNICAPGRIAAEIQRLGDFDVICLQEVADNFPELLGQAGVNQFAVLAALFPQHQLFEGICVDVADAEGKRKRFGNAILARLPVGSVRRHLLCRDLTFPLGIQRGLLEVLVQSPLGWLRILTTHLEYREPIERRKQILEIAKLHRRASKEPSALAEGRNAALDAPVTSKSALLVGDFNMAPRDPMHRILSRRIAGTGYAFFDAWKACYPTNMHPPSISDLDREPSRIACSDYVYVTQDLLGSTIDVVYDSTSCASDHRPVMCYLGV